MAICALTGGGGWYCLSGDERGDIKEKTVFAPYLLDESESDEEDEDLPDFAYDNFISRVAIFDPRYITELRSRGFNQPITLESIEDFEDYKGLDLPLKKQIEKELKEKLLFQNAKHLMKRDQELCNFGDGICGDYDLCDHVRELNQMLARMPVGKAGFWSEVLFLESKPNLMIVMRTNGSEFKIPDDGEVKSQGDLVIINLDKSQRIELNDDDLHGIYMDFEAKCGAPFDGSYNHIRRANLHLGDGIKNVSSKAQMPGKLISGLAADTVIPRSLTGITAGSS